MNLVSSITMGLLVAFAVFGCASQTASRGDTGWITLIDGGSGLDNWTRVGDANWSVVDGVIHADRKIDKANSFLLSKNSYADFRIRVEFWVSDDANSGIYTRCSELANLTDRTCYGQYLRSAARSDFRHGLDRPPRRGETHAQGRWKVEHV